MTATTPSPLARPLTAAPPKTGSTVLTQYLAPDRPDEGRAEQTPEQTPEQVVRDALREHAHLSVDVAGLSGGDDLYAVGLTSHATVTVMLACEDAFDLEFEARHLTRATFASIDAIVTALRELGAS